MPTISALLGLVLLGLAARAVMQCAYALLTCASSWGSWLMAKEARIPFHSCCAAGEGGAYFEPGLARTQRLHAHTPTHTLADRGMLKLTQQEFTSLPPEAFALVAAGSLLMLWGALVGWSAVRPAH